MADKPDNTSADYDAMSGYWQKVATILAGTEAMRAAGTTYLPQFPYEEADNYTFRSENAKFTNIFADLVEGLAAKPFAREVSVANAQGRIAEIVEDVDGSGNHLHVFAGGVFYNAIAFGLDWILVDHTPVPDGATAADERAMGARPYWVRVPAQRMLWVETAQINGREEFVYAVIYEPITERDGFSQVTKERVRILYRDRNGAGWAPAQYLVYEKGEKQGWSIIAEGPISIGVIPIVPVLTGRREEGSWTYTPPMRGCADLQIEHYQQETNLKSAKEQTAFPMLAGQGINPPEDDETVVQVGPRAVLYSGVAVDGERGEWQYVEPNANSLRFLAEQIEVTERQMRELGRQPLTANTGNLTVVTTAFAAQKGNSAVQAWALNLKDALERAFVLTEMWLGTEFGVEVSVHTDFDVETDTIEGQRIVNEMYGSGLISREAAIEEAKRRNILRPEYDADEDAMAILDDVAGGDEEDDDLMASGGQPAA